MAPKIIPFGPIITMNQDGSRTLDFGNEKILQLPAHPNFDPSVVEIPITTDEDGLPSVPIVANNRHYQADLDLGTTTVGFPEQLASSADIAPINHSTAFESDGPAAVISGVIDSIVIGDTAQRFQSANIIAPKFKRPLLGWTFFGNGKVVFDFCVGRVFASRAAVAGTSLPASLLYIYGISLMLEKDDSVSPYPQIVVGSAAAKAGIKKGDELVKIGDNPFGEALLLGANGPMSKLVHFLKANQREMNVVVKRKEALLDFTLHLRP
ncbi:MAG TPA: hypothetical protein VGL56_03420 [Fimbriimonadaceae bacterium]